MFVQNKEGGKVPKVVDHEKYRQELLRRSLDVFAEKGFASVKMRDLAQALDISTGSLYYYFPDKDQMFEQLVETLTMEDLRDFSALVETKKTARDKFDALIEFVRDNEQTLMKQTNVMLDFCRNRPGRLNSEPIRRISEQYKRFAKELLDLDADVAEMLNCVLTGLLVERFMRGNEVSIRSVIKAVSRLIALSTGEK